MTDERFKATPPAAAVAVDFEAALDAFWNVAYTQGQEQGRHDDDEGTAQKAEDDLRRAIAALSASPSPVDSRDDRDFEWKLVPIKPTLEMAEKGAEAFSLPHPQSVGAENERAALIYRLMLDASPSPVGDRDALIERLVKALQSADEWMSFVEDHLRDSQPFKRDREAIRAALSLPEHAEDRSNA